MLSQLSLLVFGLVLSVPVFFKHFNPDIRCMLAMSVSQCTLTAAAEEMNGFW